MPNGSAELWIDGESREQFADRLREHYTGLLAKRIPQLEPDALARLVSVVLRDAFSRRPLDPQPVVEEHIRLACAAISNNEHQRAVASIVDVVRGRLSKWIEVNFGKQGIGWDDIEPEFIERLRRVTLHPADPDRTQKLCGLIAKHLALDLVRKNQKKKGGTVHVRNLDLLPARPEDPVETDTIVSGTNPSAGIREVRISMLRLPFRCPPHLPHECLAWALAEWHHLTPRKLLEKGPETANPSHKIQENWVDLPLRSLVTHLIKGPPPQGLSAEEWRGVFLETSDALDRQLGSVLQGFNFRAREAYRHLLSRKCGDTCLREYVSAKRHEAVHHTNDDTESPADREKKILMGAIQDWVDLVSRRVFKQAFKELWSEPL